MADKIRHNQIIKLLEKKFSRLGYKIYRNLEDIRDFRAKYAKEVQLLIDPKLPLDIICTQEIEEETEEGKRKNFTYYTLFLVSSTGKLSETLKNRLLFYKFYLSRVISSKRLKINLVIPYQKKKRGLEFFRDNGFGLWEVIKEQKLGEIHKAETPRAQMIREFKESKDSPAKDTELAKRGEDIALFFDKYIHDAVDAIAGVSPEQFGKRYIDRSLLDKMFELKNISYGEELLEWINNHLTEKGNDYVFVSEVFSTLWEDHIKIPYTDFLETFEPSLQHIFAETRGRSDRIYRDHYLHQFQVFLLGLYIIDKLYDNFAEKYKKPEISWLIISSFHDMAYPVQLYDRWSGEFFNKVFKVPKELGYVELKSNFVDNSFLGCMSYIITRLCTVLLEGKARDNWVTERNDLVQFFYQKITEAKNHCILSSISLLKMVQDPKYANKITIDGMSSKNVLEDIFAPSALTIALHDEEVWQELKEIGGLHKLKFEDDPLSFLLIFCDNIQEWGRPSKSQVDGEEERWKKFYLKDIKYDPKKGFKITIWTPNHTKAEKFFKDKKTELGEIETFLQQPSGVKFAIRLEDKDHKGEDFEMEGPS